MASSVGFPVFGNIDNFSMSMCHLPPSDFFSCSKVCQVWRAAYDEIESFKMKSHHEKAELFIKDGKYSYKSWFVLNKTISNGCMTTPTRGPSIGKKFGHSKAFYLKYLGRPIGRPEATVEQIDELCQIDLDTVYESGNHTRKFETYPAVFLYEAVKRPIRKGEFLFLDERAKLELAETGRVKNGLIAISRNERNYHGVDGMPIKTLKLVPNATEIEVGLSLHNLAALLNFPLGAADKDVYRSNLGYAVCAYHLKSASDLPALLPCVSASTVEFVRRKVPLYNFDKTWKEQAEHSLNIACALPLLLLHGFERLETGKCMLDERFISSEEESYRVFARTPEIVEDRGKSEHILVGGGYVGISGYFGQAGITVCKDQTFDEEDERYICNSATPCISAKPNVPSKH